MRLRSVWDQQSRPNAFRDAAEVGPERRCAVSCSNFAHWYRQTFQTNCSCPRIWSAFSTRSDSAALPSIRRRAASSGGIASGTGDVRPSKLKARSSKTAQISAQARIDKMRAVYGIQRETDTDTEGVDGAFPTMSTIFFQIALSIVIQELALIFTACPLLSRPRR
jgi:hypothetical protein